MNMIKKVIIFLFVGMLSFYVVYSLIKVTYSVSSYNLEFSATLNVDENKKMIKYIPAGSTSSQLLDRLTVTGDDTSVLVQDSNGNNKSDSDIIVSGDVLSTYIGNNKKEEYRLSVSGDLNGDGIVDLIDLVQIRKYLVGFIDSDSGEIYTKTDVYYEAMDANKDGIVDIIDLVRIRKIIVGLVKDEFSEVEESVSYTATFNKNSATSIGSTSLSCTSYSAGKCMITTPSITDEDIVVGWSTNKNSEEAEVLVNTEIELTKDVTYYAITKKTYTATFDDTGLDYLEYSSLSCSIYNDSGSSCNIILPIFNKEGHFNSFWSPYKEGSSDLSGTAWSFKYFNEVGHSYELTDNVKLYPNFNHFHYDLSSNIYKYRTIDVGYSKFIGKSLYEFEEGIPQDIIDTFIDTMNDAYEVFPWLFMSGKAFVMTEETYTNHSRAYGLTHQMFVSYGGDSHFTIDLQYDVSGKVISPNASLHELAHAWDGYYYYKTGDARISSLDDFDTFYNSISSKLYVNSDGSTISKVETFAGMFTNYYWHVLGVDDSKSYYALKSGYKLDEDELNDLKVFMEKYISIAKNGYK